MVGVRLAISLTLFLAALFQGLRSQMSIVAIVIVVGLVAVIIQTDQRRTNSLRKQTMFDLGMLVTLIPIAALNAFVAADPGALLSAERAALLQTGGVLLIVVALTILVAAYVYPEDLALMLAVLLPGLLTTLALTFVLHDFRDQTVLVMIALSYFIGTAAVALVSLVDEPIRRYGPAVFYILMLLTGAIVFNPGLGNVFDRDTLVQIYVGFMILIGLAVLVFVPSPGFDLTKMVSALAPSNAPQRPRGRRPRRRDDDHSRDAPDRSR